MDTPKKITFFKDAPEYVNPSTPFSLAGSPASKREQNVNMGLEFSVDGTVGSKHPTTTTILLPDKLTELETQSSGTNIDAIMDVDQIEDNVMMYIKLIHPHDKHFIQYQYIYDNGEKYISYIKSPEYQKYRKDRKLIEQRYSSNKKYIIEVTKRKVLVFKRDKDGNIDKASAMDTLARPSYINMPDTLANAQLAISQLRIKLDADYVKLTGKPFIKQDVKARFIKDRESLINKLNGFYAIQYFYHKINGIIQHNKTINMTKINNYYSENAQGLVPRLINKEINISHDEINITNELNSNKLDLYNKIKEAILNNDKDVSALIKAYINFDTEHLATINQVIEKKKSHKPIVYLVVPPGLDYPSDNIILKPRDFKPFYASSSAKKQSSNNYGI